MVGLLGTIALLLGGQQPIYSKIKDHRMELGRIERTIDKFEYYDPEDRIVNQKYYESLKRRAAYRQSEIDRLMKLLEAGYEYESEAKKADEK